MTKLTGIVTVREERRSPDYLVETKEVGPIEVPTDMTVREYVITRNLQIECAERGYLNFHAPSQALWDACPVGASVTVTIEASP